MLPICGSSIPVLSGDNLRAYIRKVMSIPDLSREDEIYCAKTYAEENNLESAHRIIMSHLKYVVKISAKFLGYGLPMTELVSEGNAGLLKALKKFDYKKGFRFATYASWWIKAQLKDYVFKFCSMVTITNTKAAKKLFFGFRKLKKKISNRTDRCLTEEEIDSVAKIMSVPRGDVLAVEKYFSNKEVSLNSTIFEEEDTELQDYIPSKVIEQNKYDCMDEKMKKMELLNEAINAMPERLSDIIKKRYLTDNPYTLDKLSKIYSISKERVRQLECQAIKKMKEFVNGKKMSVLG